MQDRRALLRIRQKGSIMKAQEAAPIFTAKIKEAFPGIDLRTEACLKLAEEAGEAVGAAMRVADLTRRMGTLEELGEELADVVITAYRVAYVFGIELDPAIHRKTERALARGMRDPR